MQIPSSLNSTYVVQELTTAASKVAPYIPAEIVPYIRPAILSINVIWITHDMIRLSQGTDLSLRRITTLIINSCLAYQLYNDSPADKFALVGGLFTRIYFA